MSFTRKWSRFTLISILVGLLCGSGVYGELRWEDLNATRLILARDWLQLKLEVMGLRLSFPAYRIDLELGEDGVIGFTLLASSGLAEHLESVEEEEAEKMLNYHATGIRDQVEEMLEKEFPELWEHYDPAVDFRGSFLGPGEEWDDPPRTIATWKADQLSWEK